MCDCAVDVFRSVALYGPIAAIHSTAEHDIEYCAVTDVNKMSMPTAHQCWSDKRWKRKKIRSQKHIYTFAKIEKVKSE